MSKKMNLVGKVFGRLTVLEEVGRNRWGHFLWKCLCECGTIKVFDGSNLRMGDTRSCGCLNKERLLKINNIDLKGQRFGKLVVLEKFGADNCRRCLWRCICDCGNETTTTTSSLRGGYTKSCGCFQRERSSELNKAENNCNYKHGLSSTKAYACAKTQKRRSNKLKQTPQDANLNLIQFYYTVSETLLDYEVDHIKPLSKGGFHHEDNLQLLEKKLNMEKSDKWPFTNKEKIKYRGIKL